MNSTLSPLGIFGIFRATLLSELWKMIRAYVSGSKYLSYDRGSKTISCKGCLPAFVNGKEVAQYNLVIGSTYTPVPPLSSLLPMNAIADRRYPCKDRQGFLAISGISPDSFKAIVNHCALSGGSARFTLQIHYQFVGEKDPKTGSSIILRELTAIIRGFSSRRFSDAYPVPNFYIISRWQILVPSVLLSADNWRRCFLTI